MTVHKRLILSVSFGAAVLLAPATALAHVSVTPNEVGIGKMQVFTIGIPSEKDDPTVSVRLVLPGGLKEVTPTVKNGWKTDVKNSSNGEDASVTEITWQGGSIPNGMRDEFSFAAQAPATPTTLQWKTYQTYQNGSVISWDQAPSGSDDASGSSGPYATTKVVNDLTAAKTSATSSNKENENNAHDTGAFMLSGFSLLATIALFIYIKKQHSAHGTSTSTPTSTSTSNTGDGTGSANNYDV